MRRSIARATGFVALSARVYPRNGVRMSALRPGAQLIVEIEQRIDRRDERRRATRADLEQHLTACDQQLVALLERLSEVQSVRGHDRDVRAPTG